MATNQDAIHDLVKAKAAFEARIEAGATGQALTNLLLSVGSIESELGELVVQALAAVHTPQTDPFKAATAQARAFVKTLGDIKSAFNAIAQVAQAVADVLKYIA